jgi:hypothetical protein
VQHFTITFGQTIPKPFCNAGNEYVRVDGPIYLRQTVDFSASGKMTTKTFIDGELAVRSVNTVTGAVGQPARARVQDHYRTQYSDQAFSVFSKRHQLLLTPGSAPQQLHEQLTVGSTGRPQFQSDESCN